MISITEQQIKQQTLATMLASWPHKPITPQEQVMLASYADAYSKALVSSLASTVISNGTVQGGASAPGGPVLGAMLTVVPGSIASSPLDLELVFHPPDFTMQFQDRLYHGSYTPWLHTLTSTLSSSLKDAWSNWISLWSLQSFPCIGGGISAWIPPIPPAPPVPGPWTLGTIVTPVTFNGIGQSTSTALKLFSDAVVAKAKGTSVIVSVSGEAQLETMLCINSNSEKLIRCITDAYSEVFTTTTAKLFVVDAVSSGSAFGTATPPTGFIVGGILPSMVLQ
jgi:hypothetical protein